MFDMKAEISIPIRSAEGIRQVIVRYPTDSEFLEWRRKKKILQNDLGRDSYEIVPSKPEACDLALVKLIQSDEAPITEEAEAYYILDRLFKTDISSRPEREGSGYTIRMKVMQKVKTSHTLRLPSVKETMDYERQRPPLTLKKFGQQEIRLNYSAAGELYDKLKQFSEGYQGDTPVLHKQEVINVLLQQIRSDEEPGDSDDQD